MRCIRCMREIPAGTQICGHCKFPQNTPPEYPDSLAPGTELRNRFLLGRELGRGGFGITYVGFDKYLNCKVAVKEYYPQTLAARLPGEVNLFWRNSQLRDAGCQNVILEAQKMHKIGALPVAVHVLDVFYENNTAYIAMDYVEGITLKQYLLKNGVLSPEKCMELMLPVLDTMGQMHASGVIHRDISPDNIMIQPDMQPRILDLGAAKDIQTESGNTMPVARNGFSPKEQYQTNGHTGTWTDVYAICATMYYSLTGRVPPAAMDRSELDDALPFTTAVKLPQKLKDVLEDGMRVRIDKRIPNVLELKKRLQESIPQVVPGPDPIPKPKPKPKPDPKPVPKPNPKPKQKGFFSSIFAKFGKENAGPAAPETLERKGISVTVSNPGGYPMYADPDATICMGGGDDEATVLMDEGLPTPANGCLVQTSTGKRIEIDKCCFVLGRLTQGSPEGKQAADCMIADSARHISRRHAAILFDGEGFYIQDVSGKNITLLNGVRIPNGVLPESGNTYPCAYRLFDGDCIHLADEKLIFHAGGKL